MLDLWRQYSDIIMPFIFIAGAYIFGLFFQLLVVHRILQLVKRTSWQWDDLLISSLGRMPILWCTLIGAYLAIWQSNLAVIGKEYYSNGVTTLFLVSLTIVLARVAAGLMQRVPGKHLPSTTLFVNGSRLLVYALGVIIILQNLNIEITPIITAMGIGGLAVALALNETLSNLFSGVQIVASQLVRPGDFVKLQDGYTGYVTDIKSRNTTICSFPDDNRIIVPNNVLSSSIVVNYSLPEKNMWVEISLGVAYDSDLDFVERITLEVAHQVLDNVEPGYAGQRVYFRYTGFNDSSIDFTVRLFVAEFREQFTMKHEFIKALHKRYGQERIEIPFPIRTVYMKQAAGE